jgi:DNA-binding transcriptional LysR family regulator
VSRQVAALEREVGQRLLERSSRGTTLTEDGRRFLSGARQVLAAYEGLIGPRPAAPAGPAIAHDGRALMRLGIEADTPPHVVEDVRAHASAAQAVQWRITTAHEPDLRGMLLDRHVDAAVLWLPWHEPRVLSVPVLQVDILVALRADMAAEYPTPVPGSVLASHRLAIWERAEAQDSYDYWTGLLEQVAGAPVDPSGVPAHDNAQAQMLRAVAETGAITFVSAAYWRSNPRDGVEVRGVDPPLRAPLYVTWLADSPSAWIADLLSIF